MSEEFVEPTEYKDLVAKLSSHMIHTALTGSRSMLKAETAEDRRTAAAMAVEVVTNVMACVISVVTEKQNRMPMLAECILRMSELISVLPEPEVIFGDIAKLQEQLDATVNANVQKEEAPPAE